MKTALNMMPARLMGSALVLGMLVLLTGGCPTASGLLEEGVFIEVGVRDPGTNTGLENGGTTTGTPTDAENPGGPSGNANEPGGSNPTSPGESNVPSDTGASQDQPAQNSGSSQSNPPPPPPEDSGVPRQDPPSTGASNSLEQEAQVIQQSLGGMRLTYMTSDSNGEFYTSYREDHDLCSSGEFKARIVSQSSGYGTADEDVYEGFGTWRITVVGSQLMIEVNTQQDSNGYSGIDQYTLESGPDGETYLNGVRYYVTPDNPICN